MKSTRKVRKSALHAALLAAGMALAGAPALAALPTITVQGVLGNELISGATSLAYDPSPWFGKAYSLQLTVDAQGAGSLLVEDGIPINNWVPTSVAYVFTVDGNVLFAGDSLYGELETINNFTAPAGVSLPPGMVVGKVYDNYLVSGSGIALGCGDGNCDSAADTHVTMTLGFEYSWDVAQIDAIADDSLPNLLGGGPFFNGGFGDVYLDFSQGNEVAGYLEAGSLHSGVDAVAVTAVPEADTWAMLAAGLGLVGWRARRRGARLLGA